MTDDCDYVNVPPCEGCTCALGGDERVQMFALGVQFGLMVGQSGD